MSPEPTSQATPAAKADVPSPAAGDQLSGKAKSDADPSRQPVMVLNAELDGPHVFPFAGGRVAAYSRRCPGKETNNEDSLATVPVGHGGVLLVADGVGGERCGDRASAAVIESLCRVLEQRPPEAEGDRPGADGSGEPSERVDRRPAILDGIEQANRAVIELGVGAASTLALVEIWGDTVRPYHVGDSMILLVGQRGRVKWQTVPHSPVGYAIEAGVLDEQDALHHADRHLVSNIVGTEGMRIEIGPPVKMAARDTLLVASDGLFDNLQVSEIIEIIRKGKLEKAIERLAELVRQRMEDPPADQPSKPDDTSVLVYRRW